MDNAAVEQLNKQIQDEVQHALGHELTSAIHVNRMIGESMRHIGAVMEMNSAAYLPVRAEELLVEPIKMTADSSDAVLLLTRSITHEQAFMVLSNSKTVDKVRQFDVFAYKEDKFNLHQTKFVQLPQLIGDEIVRQLNQVTKGDGASLLQCIIVKNWFKESESIEKNDTLFNSDTSFPEKSTLDTAPVGLPQQWGVSDLPPVSNEVLL